MSSRLLEEVWTAASSSVRVTQRSTLDSNVGRIFQSPLIFCEPCQKGTARKRYFFSCLRSRLRCIPSIFARSFCDHTSLIEAFNHLSENTHRDTHSMMFTFAKATRLISSHETRPNFSRLPTKWYEMSEVCGTHYYRGSSYKPRDVHNNQDIEGEGSEGGRHVREAYMYT